MKPYYFIVRTSYLHDMTWLFLLFSFLTHIYNFIVTRTNYEITSFHVSIKISYQNINWKTTKSNCVCLFALVKEPNQIWHFSIVFLDGKKKKPNYFLITSDYHRRNKRLRNLSFACEITNETNVHYKIETNLKKQPWKYRTKTKNNKTKNNQKLTKERKSEKKKKKFTIKTMISCNSNNSFSSCF